MPSSVSGNNPRYLSFGYNRRQKPLRIGCPGGSIELHREIHGTVAVHFAPDGEKMADHVGRVEVNGERQTVRLIHEARPQIETPEEP